MTVTVNVTQEDIDRGKPMDPSLCPVMYGVWRAGLHPKIYAVGRSGFFGQHHDFKNPPLIAPVAAVREFIDRFDDGKKVKPFSFEIEVPEDFE